MKMTAFFRRVKYALTSLDARLSRYAFPIGAAFALMLAGALAALNIDHGPLHNLNDIGSFRARVLFIAMAAAVHLLVLLLAARVHCGSVYRLLLRELILTFGFVLLLLGINQKTYFYTQVIQPLVRAMDGEGMAAFAASDAPISAPAALILYLITRGPVYDMYLVKLAVIGAYLLVCVMMMGHAQKKTMGWRIETLLALCMILPQAFMSAACTALTDVLCVGFLCAALALCAGDRLCAVRRWAAVFAYALAVAMSGAALYALPLIAWLFEEKGFTKRHISLCIAAVLALCVPAAVAGMGAVDAVASIFRANFILPVYASGAPHALNFLPRAAVEEMPEMFMLSRLPQIDAETYAQPYYTQAHFEQAALGMTVALLAAFCALCVYISRRKMDNAGRALALVLCALMVCPGATSGLWLAADVLCVYVLLAAPKWRLPACLVLFATAGTGAYPMLGETLLPMIAGLILCLTALLMLLDIVPTGLKTEENHG